MFPIHEDINTGLIIRLKSRNPPWRFVQKSILEKFYVNTEWNNEWKSGNTEKQNPIDNPTVEVPGSDLLRRD